MDSQSLIVSASTPAMPADPCLSASRPMGPIARRLVYMVALIPLVPGLSVIGWTFSQDGVATLGFEGIRWGHFWFATLWTVAIIGIWRTLVVWTLGRQCLTAMVTLVPFAQVLYPHPLWNAGCISDDILRGGQHLFDLGLWVWLIVWVWWGWEKHRMAGTSSTSAASAREMSSTARRIVASIGVIPCAVGVFAVTMIALETFAGWSMNKGPELGLVFAVAGLSATAAWLVIWRGAVVRSPAPLRGSLVSAALCMGAPIALIAIWVPRPSSNVDNLLLWLPVVGWGAWMIYTAHLWPMGREAVPDENVTPRCSKCGYLLTGLYATRCPECGDEPTIDELWRATVGEVV